jgi:hypothetical protein
MSDNRMLPADKKMRNTDVVPLDRTAEAPLTPA